MKILNYNNTSNRRTNFTALDYKKAEGLLFSRLSSSERHYNFDMLRRSIEDAPFTIELSAKDKGKQLQGRVINDKCQMKTEGYFSALFNFNPLIFINKLVEEGKRITAQQIK